jgi:hypothetical protein
MNKVPQIDYEVDKKTFHEHMLEIMESRAKNSSDPINVLHATMIIHQCQGKLK